MPERRKSNQAKAKAGVSAETKQKTLLDLFPRKTIIVETLSIDEAREAEPSNHESDVLTMVTSDTRHTEQYEATITTKYRVESSNSHQKPLHSLFVKRSSKAPPIQEAIVESEIIVIPEDEPSISFLPPSDSLLCPDSAEVCSPQPGGSQEDPIILDSSPMSAAHLLPSEDTLSLPRIDLMMTFPASPRAKSSKDRLVPYPDGYSQHVRGPQQIYSAPSPPFPRRQQRYTNMATPLLPTLNLNQETSDAIPSRDTVHFLPYTTVAKETYLEEIPSDHLRLYPAILRLVNFDAANPSAPSSAHKAWSEKWRPTRAEEVIGNELDAIYLRDWLRALELQFDTSSTTPSIQEQKINKKEKSKEDANKTKRPRVVRAVEKHHRRKKRRIDSDDDDDWIVYSDELEDEPTQTDEADDDIEPLHLHGKDSEFDSAPSASSGRLPQQFSDHLTNTIVLAGPSGVGKTAAVYACAEELGWEVFEVYPGVGKRNGASIENMIGDVGKNHLVRKIQPSKGRDAFAMLLGKGKNPADEHSQDQHHPTRDLGFVSISDDQSGPSGASTVRQSLVLLEEVDILYKEDSNFWPTVTNFIKDCKRPVICTCNDISLVPTLDLPLQRILTFRACPAPVATSYLQGLCSAEGFLVERDSLVALYDSTCKSIGTRPASSSMSSEFTVPDLRRTINCLQFRCLTMGMIPPSGSTVQWQTESECLIEDLSDWTCSMTRRSSPSVSATDAEFSFTHDSVINHADLISFVDGRLVHRGLDGSEVFDGVEPSPDDEVGHTILLQANPTTGNAFDHRYDEIASTAMRLSRGIFQHEIRQKLTLDVKDGFRTRDLFHARVEHQVQMVEGLKNKIPLSAWAMGNYVIHMDYGPWIRHLVAVEDKEEALYMQKERTGRRTRNSGGKYERTMRVSAKEREALIATGLEWDV